MYKLYIIVSSYFIIPMLNKDEIEIELKLHIPQSDDEEKKIMLK